MEQNSKIDNLIRRFDAIYNRQNSMNIELEQIKLEFEKLKNEQGQPTVEQPVEQLVELPKNNIFEERPAPIAPLSVDNQAVTQNVDLGKIDISERLQVQEIPQPKQPNDLEKFIGENLANKIGIVITVMGIAVGVKYAIDNNLISPLTRILLGYLMGFGLYFTSVRLRPKYTDLSAVILGGALASFYFITYAAYDFYALIPQALAFVMMLVVTVFTVIAALSYDRQIIAVGGLVGAYFVPFLLSNNSDRPEILFSYMAIINVGILAVAFKRFWQILYYLAFAVTWLIFSGWIISGYRDERFALAFTFLIIFFGIFYATFLAYKFIKDKQFDVGDALLLLVNATIFYGLGYFLLDSNETGRHLLGMFTLLNAVIHFGVSMAVFKRQLADRNLFFLASGLVLVFITMAIPVQLDGHWVTLFWAGEMALVFWIGRTKGVSAYERLSYPLWVLTFLSLMSEWVKYALYDPNIPDTRITPIINILFLTTAIVTAAYLFIRKVNNTEGVEPAFKHDSNFKSTLNHILTIASIFLIFTTFFNEIATFFNQNYADSYRQIGKEGYEGVHDEIIQTLKINWLINYTLAFVTLALFLNLKKFKHQTVALITSIAAVFVLGIFLLIGLYGLGELKNAYLLNIQGEYYVQPKSLIGLRYISYALVAALIFGLYQTIQTFFNEKEYKKWFEVGFSGTVLWLIASEMVNWLEIMRYDDIYKLAISILFGVFALGLIAYGINKGKRHLRIAAIVLFAATLLKLFLYDMADMGTISKTIAMISLGVLLLVISFLYNKFKDIIFGDDDM
jgi:drug/metabolite transporter (DMT)-like permease